MTITLDKAQLYLNCYHRYIGYTFVFQYEYPEPERWGTIFLGQPLEEASPMYAGTRFSREEILDQIGPLVELECTKAKTFKAASTINVTYEFEIKRFEGGGTITLQSTQKDSLEFQIGQTLSFPAFLKLLDRVEASI